MDPKAARTEAAISGEAWIEFCDRIKKAGSLVLERSSADNEIDRAEGYRHLARLVGQGLGRLEGAGSFDPRWPGLPPVSSGPRRAVKIGADNPDNLYQATGISGQHEYRMWGPRGTVTYLGLGVYSGSFGAGHDSLGREGYLDGEQLEVDDDGSVEIILSCEPHEGNWLSMEPESSFLIIRQTFLDPDTEEPADLQIECIGAGPRPPRPPLTAAAVTMALRGAAQHVEGTLDRFSGFAQEWARQPNELHRREKDPSGDGGVKARGGHGDPNIKFYHGYWEIEPDEALVIEAMPPDPLFWNFQLNNRWEESLDYDQHRVHINARTVESEPDGRFRIVVAHDDPGVPNWLTTAGHSNGTMGLRWVRADRDEQPSTRVVKIADL